MEFESKISSVARSLLNDNEQGGFYNGTFFVESSEKTARSIFHALSTEVGLGKVQITKVCGNDQGGEYAFDFKA
jgi:hypothetical protein